MRDYKPNIFSCVRLLFGGGHNRGQNNMMQIQITVTDDNLEYFNKAEVLSFETAGMHLGAMERNYARRVEMEMSKADVAAESLKEEV